MVKYTDGYPYHLSSSTHPTPGIYSLTQWTYIYGPYYDSFLGIKYSREIFLGVHIQGVYIFKV